MNTPAHDRATEQVVFVDRAVEIVSFQKSWRCVMKLLALRKYLRQLIRNERGAALVEYGMLVGLIAVICVGAVQALGVQVQASFNSIVAALTP